MAAQRFPTRPCLGARSVDSDGNVGRFLFKSYAWCSRTSDELAAGLVKEDLIPRKAETLNVVSSKLFDEHGVGTKGARLLGIYMKNCPEWILCEYACYGIKAACVPLYHTLDLDSLKYIINHTGLTTVVCSLEHSELDNLCQLKCKGDIPSLHAVVLNEESLALVPIVTATLAKKAGLKLYTIWDVVRIGQAFPTQLLTPAPSDIATFCYTSGTTGVPKGALITHQNIIAVANAAMSSVFADLSSTDSYLSFLPLPHIFERMVLTAMLSSGGAVGFFQGNPLKIVDDTVALKPSIYCAVPRLLNKIHDKIMLATLPPSAEDVAKEGFGARMKRSMLVKALAAKMRNLREHGQLDHALWDALLFKKIKGALGMGNVRHMVSGGAPLPVSTADFFKVTMGSACSVHEGYGLTETTGGLSITEASDLSPSGHVGSVLPCVEVCLADVPDMDYLSTDSKHSFSDALNSKPGIMRCNGRGEILVRGPGVFAGYYRDPVNTRGSFTPDGWFRTGDIGLFRAGGQLQVIDRKKNVLKLSQGEYVAVEKVENVLGKCAYISQIFVYGVSTEDSLVGVVVPDVSMLANVPSKDPAELKAFLLTKLNETGRENGLHGFEIVKNLHVEREIEEWTPSNHFLTPTFKLKRAIFKKHYQGVLEDLYKELKASKPRSRL